MTERELLPPPPGKTPEADLDGLVADLPAPAVILDPDRRILAANRLYSVLFGDGEPLSGRHCYEVAHRRGLPCFESGTSCPMRGCQLLGSPCRVIHRHPSRRGAVRQVICSMPILATDGSVRAYLNLFQPPEPSVVGAGGTWWRGRSAPFRRMMDRVEKVALSDCPVLLIGEAGTGRGQIARAIHDRSPRAKSLLVTTTCSLPADALGPELFGRLESGRLVHGLLEAARGGTLLLTEIDELAPSLQGRLLRLLETLRYRPLGSVQELSADLRLISATSRDVAPRGGPLRSDLYWRLAVFPLRVPPLRERLEDLPLLVEGLLRELSPERSRRLTHEAREALGRYDFPGNLQELQGILQRALLLADGEVLRPEHLFPEGGVQLPGPEPAAAGVTWPAAGQVLPLEQMERHYLQWVLGRFSGSKRELAERLGLSERTLYRKLRRAEEETAD